MMNKENFCRISFCIRLHPHSIAVFNRNNRFSNTSSAYHQELIHTFGKLHPELHWKITLYKVL